MGRHINPDTGVVFEVDDSKDERYTSGDRSADEAKKSTPAPKKSARKSE